MKKHLHLFFINYLISKTKQFNNQTCLKRFKTFFKDIDNDLKQTTAYLLLLIYFKI